MTEKTTRQEEKKELSEAEVNVYCACTSVLKIHCHHDCIDQTAWITHAQ